MLERSEPAGLPRVQGAVRKQIELRACDLDASLPADHQSRAVWAFVASLNLLASYATLDGVGSGSMATCCATCRIRDCDSS